LVSVFHYSFGGGDEELTEPVTALAAVPSRDLILALSEHFGFNLTEVDWSALAGGDRAVADYGSGRRGTFLLERLR